MNSPLQNFFFQLRDLPLRITNYNIFLTDKELTQNCTVILTKEIIVRLRHYYDSF